MRPPMFKIATVLVASLVVFVQLQLAESSRVSNRWTEQDQIMQDIRRMPKAVADADGFLTYERNYARTNHHTGSHTSLFYKVRGLSL